MAAGGLGKTGVSKKVTELEDSGDGSLGGRPHNRRWPPDEKDSTDEKKKKHVTVRTIKKKGLKKNAAPFVHEMRRVRALGASGTFAGQGGVKEKTAKGTSGETSENSDAHLRGST